MSDDKDFKTTVLKELDELSKKTNLLTDAIIEALKRIKSAEGDK